MKWERLKFKKEWDRNVACHRYYRKGIWGNKWEEIKCEDTKV